MTTTATELLADLRATRKALATTGDPATALRLAKDFAGKFDDLDRMLQDRSEPPTDWPIWLSGAAFTDGAGPDATCGCGEFITLFDGVWMHIINPELRGTDDHDAHPC